jgi:hypothetical protein
MRRTSLAAFGAVLAWSSIAHADDAPVALTYEAPSRACPSAESFRDSVAKRRPRGTVVLGDSDAKLRARVALSDSRAKVSVSSGDRIVAEREVTGRSCAELARASALFVAVFADREDSPAEPEPDGDPEPEPTPQTAPPKPTGAPVVAPVNRERDATALGVKEPKHLAILANPLSLLANRFSVQVEWVPTKHHALVANPFFFHTNRKHTEDGVAYDLGDQNGLGAELGYRYYTGTHGPNGFFVGPSLVVASFYKSGGEPRAQEKTFSLTNPENYNAYGAALDIGGQFLVGPGVVFGVGVGAQYLFTTDDKSGGLASIWEGTAGFAPRVLASLGYAF